MSAIYSKQSKLAKIEANTFSVSAAAQISGIKSTYDTDNDFVISPVYF